MTDEVTLAHHCADCYEHAYRFGVASGQRKRRYRTQLYLFLIVYLFVLLVFIEALKEAENGTSLHVA